MALNEQMAEAEKAISPAAKVVFDGLSITTVLASLMGYLPALAAGASLVWTLIRIYETKTVQRWLKK